jgi:pilus assembly protein CpaE
VALEIRVLTVEETKNRSEFARMIRGGDVTVVGEAGFGPEAVTVAQECEPDVILLSLEEPIARPLRTIELLTVSQPSVGIVVLSSLNDREAIRKAMRAGVRDFLTKPASPDEVQRAIFQVYENQQKKQVLMEPDSQKVLSSGEVIVLHGAKGGIGKSTLSVNLAVAIATETKQRVALVDLDAQMGDIALMLSIVPDRSIMDAAMNGERLSPDLLNSLVYTDRTGIRVLPSPATPEDSADLGARQVGQVIESLSHTFDYVIVDTAPILNDINLTILEKATLVLLLTTPELTSLKRTKISLGLLLRSWNFPEDKVKLMVNYPHAHSGITTHDIESTLDYPIFWKIPYDPSVAEAMKSGRPCLETKPGSRFSRNVSELARAVCGLHTPTRGLFSLLLSR